MLEGRRCQTIEDRRGLDVRQLAQASALPLSSFVSLFKLFKLSVNFLLLTGDEKYRGKFI